MAACRLMVPDFRAGHSREVNPQVRATACRSARAVARQEAARCALSSAPARNQAGPHPRSSGRAGRPAGRRFLASPQPAYGRAWQACGASASLPGGQPSATPAARADGWPGEPRSPICGSPAAGISESPGPGQQKPADGPRWG
jgi:hypothetical protein